MSQPALRPMISTMVTPKESYTATSLSSSAKVVAIYFGRRGKNRGSGQFPSGHCQWSLRADDFYILNLLGTAVPGQLIHCVHGVIPAYVYEIGDVILPENINQNPVLGSVLFRLCQLIAAGTQGGGRVWASLSRSIVLLI